MNHNDLFAIGIPTINRADLLNPTLEKYVDDFRSTQIYIVDNGEQTLFMHPRITVFRPGRNLGVAGSWNFLCDVIFKGQVSKDYPQMSVGIGNKSHSRLPHLVLPSHPYAWLLNDDVYSGKLEHEIEGLLNTQLTEPRSFLVCPDNWSSFILPSDTFTQVGPFDEAFYPAYYEDNDYRYRMKRAEVIYIRSKALQPSIFRGSCSIAKDPSLGVPAQANLARYKAKWGGVPDEETFRIPFDGKEPAKKPLENQRL